MILLGIMRERIVIMCGWKGRGRMVHVYEISCTEYSDLDFNGYRIRLHGIDIFVLCLANAAL